MALSTGVSLSVKLECKPCVEVEGNSPSLPPSLERSIGVLWKVAPAADSAEVIEELAPGVTSKGSTVEPDVPAAVASKVAACEAGATVSVTVLAALPRTVAEPPLCVAFHLLGVGNKAVRIPALSIKKMSSRGEENIASRKVAECCAPGRSRICGGMQRTA